MALDVKTKKYIVLTLTLLIIAVFGLVFWFVGRPMVQFVSQPELFRQWVAQHGIWGALAFVGMTVLQIVVAFVPGEPLELAAGYAFGFWQGTFLCTLGILIGSSVVFFTVRRFGRAAVELFFPAELSPLFAKQKAPALVDLSAFFHSRHSQGPANLFCRPDSH